MSDIDVQHEWQRLQKAYGEMSDEELTALAGEAYDLSDIAQQALESQLSARGLKTTLVTAPPPPDAWETPEPPGDFDPEDLGLTHFRKVWNLAEAKLILKMLHDAAVPAYLGPENLESADDFHGSFENGIEVRVRNVDFGRAQRACMDAFASLPTEPETNQPFVKHCPSCHSEDITLEELIAAASATDSAPSQRFRWKCESCGHQWEDDGVEE